MLLPSFSGLVSVRGQRNFKIGAAHCGPHNLCFEDPGDWACSSNSLTVAKQRIQKLGSGEFVRGYEDTTPSWRFMGRVLMDTCRATMVKTQIRGGRGPGAL